MSVQQQRELYLLDYLDALDAGDDATIERLLKLAEKDPIFTRMIVDLHSELDTTALFPPDYEPQIPDAILDYQDETKPFEDKPPTLQRKPRQQQAQFSGWLPLVAVLALTVIGGLLLSGGLPETLLAAIQSDPDDKFILIEGETDCTTASIPESECDALLLLYDSTDGENWLVNLGWNQNNDPCRWRHVTCRNGHVAELSLNSNRLKGIVINLDNLPYLEVFDAGNNQLTGNLALFADLPQLRYLDLSSNKYEAGLPDLLTLPVLAHLDLSDNGLTGTLSPVLRSDSLTYLDLSGNALISRVPDFNDFPNLRHVDLSANRFVGVLQGLNTLTQLEHLDISHNRLETDLSGLEVATNLQYLDISHNEITEIVVDLAAFAQLETVIADGIEAGVVDE